MRIGWLCPLVDEPETCVGAVVEALDPQTGKSEFIPVVLPDTPLKECMSKPFTWVVSMMADELIVFHTAQAAEQFLFETFQLYLLGIMTPLMVMELVEKYNGFGRHVTQYGIVLPGAPYDMN